MTYVGFIGALLSLVALAWASTRGDNSRLAVFVLMLLMHLSTTVIYYFYVQVYDADTSLYYEDAYGFFGTKSGWGTWFTIDLVQTMRQMFGGTYLDYFLIFQTFGFWGLTLVARTIEEICIEVNVAQPPMLFVALFLPGLYFWTSAIGKDAPLFLATALCTWAALNIQRRYIWFALGLAIMFPFRPHITLISLTAMGGAFALDTRLKTGVRALLGVLLVVGLVVVVGTLQETLDVDSTSAKSIGSFISGTNEASDQFLEGSLASASYPVKLFSLLFRPFFVDASGFLGVVASFENVFVFLVFWTLVRRWHLVVELFRKIAFVRFVTIFCGIMIFFLSALYYNVGLGLRQKAMYMPAFLALYATVAAVGLARVRQAGSSKGPSNEEALLVSHQ